MRLRLIILVTVILVAGLAIVAWNRSSMRETPSGAAGGDPGSPDGAGMPAVGDATPQDPGVTWKKPPRWVEELATGMRIATYTVPASTTGGEPARCAVYYFGSGQGGGTDANIERWIGEFEQPSAPARRVSKVGGLKVSRVEVSGTYVAHADPAGGTSGPMTDWTLLGAIVEGPNGALFFKLTGPSDSAGQAAKEFDGLLASLRKK